MSVLSPELTLKVYEIIQVVSQPLISIFDRDKRLVMEDLALNDNYTTSGSSFMKERLLACLKKGL